MSQSTPHAADGHTWSVVATGSGPIFYCTGCPATETLHQRRVRFSGLDGTSNSRIAALLGWMQLAHLTPTERLVLGCLVSQPGTVVSGEALIEAVWGQSGDMYLRAALRSHVYSLRRKLKNAGVPCSVATLPREGLKLVLDDGFDPPSALARGR